MGCQYVYLHNYGTGSVNKNFKLRRKAGRAATSKATFIRAEQLRDPADEPPFFIRGIKAGSKEEYWVSLALNRIQESEGWNWEYQVPIYGGRTIAGGLVIDFILYTPLQVTWISPMGRFWHTGHNEDRMKEIDAARKKNARLIAFFTDEIPTKEITYIFLKGKLGL